MFHVSLSHPDVSSVKCVLLRVMKYCFVLSKYWQILRAGSSDDKIPCFVLFSRMILLQIGEAHCDVSPDLGLAIKHWADHCGKMSQLSDSSVRTLAITLICGMGHRLDSDNISSVSTLARITGQHGSQAQQRRPPDLASRPAGRGSPGLSPHTSVLAAADWAVLWPPPGVRGTREPRGRPGSQLPQTHPGVSLTVLQVVLRL